MTDSKLPFVQIYILSRNRLESLLLTIESCLSIDYPNYEIIISDNSTNEEVFNGLKNHPKKNLFKVLRRPPLTIFNQHINLIKSEVQAPYFMMFHDDDLFLPNCLKVYIKIMEENLSIGACAGNTKMIYSNEKSKNLYCNLSTNKILLDEDEFLESYYGKSNGHPPWPFYLYRTDIVRNIDVVYNEGLIHSDGVFIFKIMKKSGLYWTSEIVGYYHLHSTNISRLINMRAINSLYHYFRKETKCSNQILYRYKYRNRLRFYIQNKSKFLVFINQSKHRKLICYTSFFVAKNILYYIRKLISMN